MMDGYDEIFRVEYSNGFGPYRNPIEEDGYYNAGLGCHCNNPTHPSPYREFGRDPKPNELCGFKNLSQLKEWFADHELEILERHGYNIKKCYGKITELGNYQVLFVPLT